MVDKNNSLKSYSGYLKSLVIVMIVIAITWFIGKGVLTFLSSLRQMQ